MLYNTKKYAESSSSALYFCAQPSTPYSIFFLKSRLPTGLFLLSFISKNFTAALRKGSCRDLLLSFVTAYVDERARNAHATMYLTRRFAPY